MELELQIKKKEDPSTVEAADGSVWIIASPAMFILSS
jgi:hypothetical protein